MFLLHSSVSAFDQSCTVKFNSPQLLQSDSKHGGRTMSGAAQVIKKMCEMFSLFKLRRELTSTPGPLPKVLQNLHQACAAATGKELAF